ncbi:MAG TPA: methyltransferase domain-containing protein [Humisphaera sp.]|jgi:SAM-dependent methyltransferase|nr:methyltransferase domain-containing protein [Humisphaera sp.]
MSLAQLLGKRLARQREFDQWARDMPGVHPLRHWHALRICWPILSAGRQTILDVGANPLPWLRTIRHFAGARHTLWSGCQGGESQKPQAAEGIQHLDVEFDIWSPFRQADATNTLPERTFSLITALYTIEYLYHPDAFLRAAADALTPNGAIVITASNVAGSHNILGLLRGGGLSANLDSLIRPQIPRPRVREYCWRELRDAAFAAGLAPVAHGFYDDPADRVNDEDQRKIESAASPLLSERPQLQSEMFLVLRKPTGLRRLRPAAAPFVHAARVRLGHLRARLRRA